MSKEGIKWVNISHVATDPQRERDKNSQQSGRGAIPRKATSLCGRRQATVGYEGIYRGLGSFWVSLWLQLMWGSSGSSEVTAGEWSFPMDEQRQYLLPLVEDQQNAYVTFIRHVRFYSVLMAFSHQLLLHLRRRGEFSSCWETPSHPNRLCCDELQWSSWRRGIQSS